jgi:hypothetical protein
MSICSPTSHRTLTLSPTGWAFNPPLGVISSISTTQRGPISALSTKTPDTFTRKITHIKTKNQQRLPFISIKLKESYGTQLILLLDGGHYISPLSTTNIGSNDIARNL